MQQARDLGRTIDKKFYEEHENLNVTNNYHVRYGVVTNVNTKTVLFGDLYQVLFVINVQGNSKEYYPWDASSVYKPNILDRIKLVDIANNDYYGYYVNLDTLQFSSTQFGHVDGSYLNNVRILDVIANIPTMMPGDKIVRSFYDNYLKFNNQYVQLIHGLENISPEVLNNWGFDKCNSLSGGATLILSKLSLDKEIVRDLQFLQPDVDYSFYDRNADNDDNRFSSSAENSTFNYSKGNKPSLFNLDHDAGGALLIGDSIRLYSPSGELDLQNAVLGQNLFSWLTNLTVHLERMNESLSAITKYVTDVKTKQENDVQSILNWINASFANHTHASSAPGSPTTPPFPTPSFTPALQVREIPSFDENNKNLFEVLRDKIATILSKVIGLN